MKPFHTFSFILGLLSGLLILVLFVGGTRLIWPSSSGGSTSTFSQQGGPSLTRMAQRLGITEDALSKELATGKTLQQIAQEHGVQFGGRRSGSGSFVRSGSGSFIRSGSGSTSTGNLIPRSAVTSSANKSSVSPNR